VAVDVAIADCRHRPHQPLLPQSLSPIPAAISFVSPSAIVIGQCHLCHRWLLQLPSPLAITIAVAIAHCRELLPWHGKNSI
jgi:hypothetical protein